MAGLETGAWPAFGAGVGVAVEPRLGVATGEALRAVWIGHSPCRVGEKEPVMDESSSSLITLFLLVHRDVLPSQLSSWQFRASGRASPESRTHCSSNAAGEHACHLPT